MHDVPVSRHGLDAARNLGVSGSPHPILTLSGCAVLLGLGRCCALPSVTSCGPSPNAIRSSSFLPGSSVRSHRTPRSAISESRVWRSTKTALS